MSDTLTLVVNTVLPGLVLGGLLAFVWLFPLLHEARGGPRVTWVDRLARTVVTTCAAYYVAVKIIAPIVGLL